MVEPGQSIPFELYAAVAGILAFLYRQKVEERVRQDRRAKEREQTAEGSAGLIGSKGRAERMKLAGVGGFGGGM
jgi:flagellar biosynthetic protein FlhB